MAIMAPLGGNHVTARLPPGALAALPSGINLPHPAHGKVQKALGFHSRAHQRFIGHFFHNPPNQPGVQTGCSPCPKTGWLQRHCLPALFLHHVQACGFFFAPRSGGAFVLDTHPCCALPRSMLRANAPIAGGQKKGCFCPAKMGLSLMAITARLGWGALHSTQRNVPLSSSSSCFFMLTYSFQDIRASSLAMDTLQKHWVGSVIKSCYRQGYRQVTAR